MPFQWRFITGTYCLFTMVIFLCFCGCKKLVTVDTPANLLTSDKIFESDNTATSAVLGIYTKMMAGGTNITNSAMSAYAGIYSDELKYIPTTSANITQFNNSQLNAANTILATNYWNFAYTAIYQVNSCLNGLTSSTSLTPSVKQQLYGECKLSRAYIYFYLVNLFGDVPIVTGTDYSVNASLPRSSVSDVNNLIVADLIDAIANLTESYPESDKLRPNKWAATALLAREYLYLKQWGQAQAKASLVINSTAYSLESDPNNVFLTSSKEALWQMSSVVTGYPTPDGQLFVPSSTTVKPNYILTSQLLSAFETGDKRASEWISSNKVSGVSYSYPYKYKVRYSTVTPYTQYYMTLRLAEQYLIRAEAEAEQNNTAACITDLNVIRARAGLTGLSATLDQNACLAAVAQENRIEFFAEWGHRWLDLKRTGQATQILSSLKSGWQATAVLFPVPQSQILLNSSLTQNPGY